MIPDTTGFRHRSKSQPRVLKETSFVVTTYDPNSSPSVRTGVQGPFVVRASDDDLHDVSIKGFHRRQANGEIFNNPMVKRTYEYKNPTFPYSANLAKTSDRRYYSTYRGSLWFEVPPFKLSLDEQNLIDNAVTQAYSNISAQDGNTLLWLGEFKETVQMLFQIGEAIKALHIATKPERIKWMKGQLSVAGQQKLTLALLFGILPLEQSIADFMEGLFRNKENGTRSTARGFRVGTKSGTFNDVIPDSVHAEFVRSWNETLEVSVRAGVLYDIDLDKLPWLALMLDPKSVVSTAYALARLSFVIDWFINVGGTLAAWSPSFGTNELSAWVTVETVRTLAGNIEYVPRPHSGDMVASGISGSSSYSVQERVKYRVPVSRKDLAIFPRIDVNLDMSKIASLVLLFTKIK